MNDKQMKQKAFVLGREAWRKICAVEGIILSEEAERMFEEFDRLGLSAEERRRRIIAKYTDEGGN